MRPTLAEFTPADIAAAVPDLRRRILPKALPRGEKQRTYYGKSLDMQRIEAAIRQADYGLMVGLADMERESLSLDPHSLSCAQKRFGPIGALPWKLTPATGPGVDKRIAREVCDRVHSNLRAIPFLGSALYLLSWAEFDGRAGFELHWSYRGGRYPWWLDTLSWIHPRRLSFGPERELQVIDTTQLRGDFVPQGIRMLDHPAKFVWWKPALFCDYPEREGLGPRTLYWSFFKRFSWRMRMVLTELFGQPWRIVKATEEATIEDLDEAEDAAERLGQDVTARFGKGIELDVVFPGEQSGNLFSMNDEGVDKQLSKLFLGNTGTTETDQGNRANGIVAKAEQDSILVTTGQNVSEVITEQLCKPIVVLNEGADMAVYTPTFSVDTQPARDAQRDLDLAERAVKLQVPVAIDDIREIAGLRAPDDDEPYVVMLPGGVDPLGMPIPERIQVIDPSKTQGDGADAEDIADAITRQEDEGLAGQDDAAEEDQDDADDPSPLHRRGKGRRLEADRRASFQGIDVVIDRPKGFVQRGVNEDTGERWERTYETDYGYIPGTSGGDGEGLDVYLGPVADAQDAYWILQVDADGAFDEYKLMLGFASEDEARAMYVAHVPERFLGALVATPMGTVLALLGLEPDESGRALSELCRAHGIVTPAMRRQIAEHVRRRR